MGDDILSHALPGDRHESCTLPCMLCILARATPLLPLSHRKDNSKDSLSFGLNYNLLRELDYLANIFSNFKYRLTGTQILMEAVVFA
jgi:hypothetical protein